MCSVPPVPSDTGVELLRADTYFRSQSELTSIGERSRHIHINTSRIHHLHKIIGRPVILRHNTFTMSRTIDRNVGHSRLYGHSRRHCHFVVQKLCSESIRRSMFQQVGRVRSLQIIVTQVIGIDFHIVLLQTATKSGKVVSRFTSIIRQSKALHTLTRRVLALRIMAAPFATSPSLSK